MIWRKYWQISTTFAIFRGTFTTMTSLHRWTSEDTRTKDLYTSLHLWMGFLRNRHCISPDMSIGPAFSTFGPILGGSMTFSLGGHTVRPPLIKERRVRNEKARRSISELELKPVLKNRNESISNQFERILLFESLAHTLGEVRWCHWDGETTYY